MTDITKERADELHAAWEAASDTQRLTMNRMSWFGAETISYFEHQPSNLERKAAARIEALEEALRWYVKHVQGCEGTDFLSDSHCGDDDEPHLSVARAFRETQY